MSTYERASKEIEQKIARIMERYHEPLGEAEVTIDTLLCFARRDANDDPIGPAIKNAGYACMATTKIVGIKDRAKGQADAELLLDGDRWPELSDAEQDAVIDHELTHLELQVGDDGLRIDDLGRPKLRMRLHDHQFGWFDDIVRRHGRNSIEWHQYEHFEDVSYKQLWLPCIEEVARS
jgi:hypothetical protein